MIKLIAFDIDDTVHDGAQFLDFALVFRTDYFGENPLNH